MQFFGEKHAVFFASFAKMYPFMNKIAEKWCVVPKIVKIFLPSNTLSAQKHTLSLAFSVKKKTYPFSHFFFVKITPL